MNSNFKTLRKLLHLSQTGFGEKLGVSRDVIGNIEYGRVQPKDVFINHVCAIFNVNKEWLVGGKGDIFNSNAMLTRELDEAMALFSSLNPKLQKYALQQLRGLIEVQNQDH